MKASHIFLLTLLAANMAGATTLTVTSTADNGPGSLRAAMATATDGDTIDASSVSGTILLTSGELLITNTVTILGPGPAILVVDGNATSRVFHIGSNIVVSISDLTITNGSTAPYGIGGGIVNDHGALTVSNCNVSGNSANAGGGIFNDGSSGGATLIILNSTVNGNWNLNGLGGGILNSGAFGGSARLIINNSTISGNSSEFGGGGIANFGRSGSVSLEIINSTLIGNSGGQGAPGLGGGGIYNDGSDGGIATVQIVNTILSGNSVRNQFGGGIFNQGSGGRATLMMSGSTISSNSADAAGGIYNYGRAGNATLALTNCTLSGNSDVQGAYGIGGIVNDGRFGGRAALTIVNSTLNGNSGAGIWNQGGSGGDGKLEIGSTILNAGALGGSLTNLSGTITSLGYNLSSDNGAGYLSQPTDLVNTDPMLAPLLDHGSTTVTYALLCGSPAIDHGYNFSGSTTDRRGVGFTRTFDDPSVPNASGSDGTDIGAYEVQPGDCAPLDSDRDGVPDAMDQCPDTLSGNIVDTNGCSIAQLVPCDGPRSGGTWKNHGQYVRAVLQSATDFLKAGLITRRQWGQIVTGAAHSKCGWNRRSDHEGDRDWHRDWDRGRDADWRDSRRD